jgi:hypothetical protein
MVSIGGLAVNLGVGGGRIQDRRKTDDKNGRVTNMASSVSALSSLFGNWPAAASGDTSSAASTSNTPDLTGSTQASADVLRTLQSRGDLQGVLSSSIGAAILNAGSASSTSGSTDGLAALWSAMAGNPAASSGSTGAASPTSAVSPTDLLKALSSQGNLNSLLASSFGAAVLSPSSTSSAAPSGMMSGLVSQAISAYTQQQQAATTAATSSGTPAGSGVSATG